MAVLYRQLRTGQPDIVWWQAVEHNLAREAVFVTIDTCRGGYLHHPENCSPGDLDDLSLVGRSFKTGVHYHQLQNRLVDRMVAPDKQLELDQFRQDRQIDNWSLVFDLQIDPAGAGYFRFRLESVPASPSLAAELAEAGLISGDQLDLLTRGWQRYRQLPEVDGDYWLDWAEAVLPFGYGRLEFQPRQELVSRLRQQGVYRVDFDQVGQPLQPDPAVYDYSLQVDCQRLFEFWPEYARAVGRPEAEAERFSADRCHGPAATDSDDRLYDHDLTVRVDIGQGRMISLAQHYPDYFVRQTLSPPDQDSPWDVDPPANAPQADFDEQIGRLLPVHDPV